MGVAKTILRRPGGAGAMAAAWATPCAILFGVAALLLELHVDDLDLVAAIDHGFPVDRLLGAVDTAIGVDESRGMSR